MGAEQETARDRFHREFRQFMEGAQKARGERFKNRNVGQDAIMDEVERTYTGSNPVPHSQVLSGWGAVRPDKRRLPRHDDVFLAVIKVLSKWLGQRPEDEEADWLTLLSRARSEAENKRPRRSRWPTVASTEPGLLEIQTAPPLRTLTPYLPRAHDQDVAREMEGSLHGGSSRLLVLTGESATGKTRCLYNALMLNATDRPLVRPTTAQALVDLIEAGEAGPETVLWLNEAQRFLDGIQGEVAAVSLRQLLESSLGVLAVATLWDEHWGRLADPHNASHVHAQALLAHPHLTSRIRLSRAMSRQEVDQWHSAAVESDDPRLTNSWRAGATDGTIIQHLTGGPEVLSAYLRGPGNTFTPPEHAIITAALDARRMGHHSPLPVDALAEAADGTLPTQDRSPEADWAVQALKALSNSDGRTLAPLTGSVIARRTDGLHSHYTAADYLDQHTRRCRQDQPVSPALWQALAKYTAGPDDLVAIATSAQRRGLFALAVRLWQKAVLAGYPGAGQRLLDILSPETDPDGLGALWIARHTAITRDILDLPNLINRLRQATKHRRFYEALFSEVITAQEEEFARTEKDIRLRTAMTAPCGLAKSESGALEFPPPEEALFQLVFRIYQSRDLTPVAFAYTWDSPIDSEQEEVEEWFSGRADAIRPILEVLKYHLALRKTGHYEAAFALADRGDAVVDRTKPDGVRRILRVVEKAGYSATCQRLAAHIATHASLSAPDHVAGLLEALLASAQTEAIDLLMKREPDTSVRPDDAHGLMWLYRAINAAGHREAGVFYRDKTLPLRLGLALYGVGRDEGIDDRLLKPDTYSIGQDGRLEDRLLRTHDAAGQRLLEDARWIARDLRHSQRAGEHEQLQQLIKATVDRGLYFVASVVQQLRDAGDDKTVQAFYQHVPEAEELHRRLRIEALQRAVKDLLDESATPPRPHALTLFLPALHETHQHTTARRLSQHTVSHADLTDPGAVAHLLAVLHDSRHQDDIDALLERDPVAHADLTDPGAVAHLLAVLHDSRHQDDIDALLERDPVAHADLTDPGAVAHLLAVLHELQLQHQADRLAERASGWNGDTDYLGGLIAVLHATGHSRACERLAEHAAAHVNVGLPYNVVQLRDTLRDLGLDVCARALMKRALNAGLFVPPSLQPYGLNLDGSPADPWTWMPPAQERSDRSDAR
ncbi:hypothetical protein OG512_00450 [Streptomyces sp. NBC_01378]|uniref:ATP-binding protein n=1 Tax=Streptomyces sp. NBC_00119 TaxID=2975659 RepID=A0AAU1UM96_9ACTN